MLNYATLWSEFFNVEMCDDRGKIGILLEKGGRKEGGRGRDKSYLVDFRFARIIKLLRKRRLIIFRNNKRQKRNRLLF